MKKDKSNKNSENNKNTIHVNMETSADALEGKAALEGVVVRVMNRQAQVLLDGETVLCALGGNLAAQKHALLVGDRVQVSPMAGGQHKLDAALPRKTLLCRGDRRTPGESIPVAANAQYLLTVVTADYLLHQAGFAEMAIIAAKRAEMKVGLFISKWDQQGEKAQAVLQQRLQVYRASADAVFTGAAHAPGDELVQMLKGKTTAIIGERGCGKTTLLRAVLRSLPGGADAAVATGSTHASVLHAGEGETYLIDTPGFRDFALPSISGAERDMAFAEIAQLAQDCRFGNCSHTHEDGCRVREALRTNELCRARYQAYQGMAGTAGAAAEQPKSDYRHTACGESFTCKVCGALVLPEGAGSRHRNHCPHCLHSLHADDKPGDRASLCGGVMEPVSVWVRKDGEWAVIHRCKLCGAFSSNRIAADDNPMLLMSIAVKPLSMPPFPLAELGKEAAR